MKARLQKIARKLYVVHEKELDSFFNYDYIFVVFRSWMWIYIK